MCATSPQEELKELAALGLSIVYVGVESGDDEVLARVNKGETFATALDALQKLGAGGDQALGDDPGRPGRPGAVATARGELGGAYERRSARISRHAWW